MVHHIFISSFISATTRVAKTKVLLCQRHAIPSDFQLCRLVCGLADPLGSICVGDLPCQISIAPRRPQGCGLSLNSEMLIRFTNH